jgi:hypothetical protein
MMASARTLLLLMIVEGVAIVALLATGILFYAQESSHLNQETAQLATLACRDNYVSQLTEVLTARGALSNESTDATNTLIDTAFTRRPSAQENSVLAAAYAAYRNTQKSIAAQRALLPIPRQPAC